MTVWAFRDGILAVDSCSSSGDLGYRRQKKVALDLDGNAAVAAGDGCDCAAFLRWVVAGYPDDKKPTIGHDFVGEVYQTDGCVKQFNHNLNWALQWSSLGFFAGGSGREAALAAMATGATAEEAVRHACRLLDGCAEPIEVVHVGKPES